MQQDEFWDHRARKYDDDITRHDSLYTRTIEATRLMLTQSDVVLDLGCGSGEIGLDIAPHVQRLHGIDVSGEMIQLAKGKAGDRLVGNAEFRCADAFDRELVVGSFSAATAFNIFHLVDDIPAVLARLHDLLTPGGLLISQTPCLAERRWWIRSMVGLAQRLELAPPIRSLTFAEIEALVTDAGFEILESGTWDQEEAVRRVVATRPGRVARPAAEPGTTATQHLTDLRAPDGPSGHAFLASEIPAAIEADAIERV